MSEVDRVSLIERKEALDRWAAGNGAADLKRMEEVAQAQSIAMEALRQRNIALKNQLAGAVKALSELVEFVESIDGKADDFGELKVVSRAKAILARGGGQA